MKCAPLMVVLLALVPSPAYAQNQQFSDCRTLEAAGNFIGSDEALVNGLVCKVVKRKANSGAPTPVGTRATDRSEALLGIVEPEVLRSKEREEASAGGARPAPGVTMAPAPSNSLAAGASAASSPVTTPKPSLGEIARAYRENAKTQITGVPDGRDLEPLKPSDGVGREMVLSNLSNKIMPPTVQPPPARGAGASRAAATAQVATKTQLTVAVPRKSVSGPQAAPQASTSQVTALAPPKPPPAKSETSPANVELGHEPSKGLRTSFQAMEAKSPSASDLQAPAQAAVPASSQKAPSSDSSLTRPQESLTATIATPSATAGAAEPRPEPLATAVSFAAPPLARTNPSTPSDTNDYEEDAAFREGQAPTCRKNVSLGSMEKDKLFLAIPDWAFEWLEKNQRRFPGICFSDSLMSGAKNYLVVFNIAAPSAEGSREGKDVSAATEMTPGNGMGRFTTGYGAMWHYTYERTVTTTITSASAEKAPHNQSSALRYATAYSEQGTPVSRHLAAAGARPVRETSHKPGKKEKAELSEFRPLEELLGKIIEDVAKQ